MADVTKITLPNGTTKDIKDATARAQANWNTNNGVKNFATVNNFSNTGYYKDILIDGSLTGYVTVYIGNITSTDIDANQCAVLFIYTDDTSSVIHLVNRNTASSFSVNLETKVLKSIRIYSSDNYVHSSGDTVTVTNLMVCPKFLYDADSTYEPYALPNTKITPELIELVDSGAKNLVNSTSGSGTRWIDMPVDIPAGEYAVSFATLSTTWEVSANQLQISFMDSNYDIVTDGYTYINYTTKNGVYKLNNTCKIIRLYASPTSVSGKVVTYTNMMLCTKAAWDVSQKFVPYRQSYEETVEQVAENESNISLVDLYNAANFNVVIGTAYNPNKPNVNYVQYTFYRDVSANVEMTAYGYVYVKDTVSSLTVDTVGATVKTYTGDVHKGYARISVPDEGDGTTCVGFVVLNGKYVYSNLCSTTYANVVAEHRLTANIDSISENNFDLYTSSSTNLPVNSDCFIRTTVSLSDSSRTRLQEAFVVSTGVSYVRTMSNGVWNNWLQLTNQ